MRRLAAALVLLPLSAVAPAGAEDATRLSGDLTTRADYYRLSGDDTRLPARYRHGGWQAYQDANLQGVRQAQGRRTEVSLSGVLSESDYRTDERGGRLEWAHLRHEDARTRVPYRLDLGDQHGAFSPLTLDQPLRAIRLEAQPGSGHSVVWLSGEERTDVPVAWDDPAQRGLAHRVHGASWLMQEDSGARYAVQLLWQSPDEDWLEESSVIASVGGNWEWWLAGQELLSELELAQQEGRSVPDAPAEGRGVRARMQGRADDAPVYYDFAYRRLEEGFLPLATGLTPDARETDAGAGVDLTTRLSMKGRYHGTVSQASGRRLNTDDFRLTLEAADTLGLATGTDHAWNLRRRERSDRPGDVDSRSNEARWTVHVGRGEEVRSSTRVAASWMESDDYTHAGRDFRQRRLELSHRRRLPMGGMELSATPGVDYRRRTGHLGVGVLHPTLVVDASARSHRVALRLGYRELRRDAAAGFEEYGLTLNYRFRVARHTLGLEYDRLLLTPEEGDAAAGWRAGMFWRYEFDYPSLPM